MTTFAIVTRAGLAQEDSIEREFWQGAYIAAIGNGLGDMSAAEPVSS